MILFLAIFTVFRFSLIQRFERCRKTLKSSLRLSEDDHESEVKRWAGVKMNVASFLQLCRRKYPWLFASKVFYAVQDEVIYPRTLSPLIASPSCNSPCCKKYVPRCTVTRISNICMFMITITDFAVSESHARSYTERRDWIAALQITANSRQEPSFLFIHVLGRSICEGGYTRAIHNRRAVGELQLGMII